MKKMILFLKFIIKKNFLKHLLKLVKLLINKNNSMKKKLRIMNIMELKIEGLVILYNLYNLKLKNSMKETMSLKNLLKKNKNGIQEIKKL